MSETFALDVQKFAQKFGVNADIAARKFILDVQRDVMLATPVDTGLLRSSWFVGVGSEPMDIPVTPDAKDDATVISQSAASQQAALSTLTDFRFGQTAYLTNNQVYANVIEYEGHSKTKAPEGMLRITVARYQAEMGRWS